MRESPSVELMSLLHKSGAIISYSDPWVPVFPKMRNYSFDLKSVDLSGEVLVSYDMVLLATDHDVFDYDFIKKHAKIIVDTRGVYLDPADNVFKA